MKEHLNWAVLGTGVIANQMAQALQKMGKPLYAVGNRTYEKAVAFAKKYGVQKVYSEIDEMFTDENVDIIYITSPHNTHYAFMKKALLHGKHLFVEKSIALNSRELDEMIALAREKNLILAEAMTISDDPWIQLYSPAANRIRFLHDPSHAETLSVQRIRNPASLRFHFLSETS